MSSDTFMGQFLKQARWVWAELRVFIRTIVFWRSCLGVLLMFTGLFVGVLQCNKCYTRHGESLKVPQFENKTYSEALSLASKSGLSLIVTDSVYRIDKKGRYVLSQIPAAGNRVKKGRSIYVTVSRSSADLVSLPDIRGKDNYDQYSRMLSVRQIKTLVAEKKFDPKLENGTIMAVIYEGKDITNQLTKIKVPRGCTLEFIVSERTTNEREVPELVCLTLEEARFILNGANLAVGNIVKDPNVLSPESAYVYRQEPAAGSGTTVRAGDQVNLFLAAERPNACD
jgi:beta-lactam-binding protein with PASTA domain